MRERGRLYEGGWLWMGQPARRKPLHEAPSPRQGEARMTAGGRAVGRRETVEEVAAPAEPLMAPVGASRRHSAACGAARLGGQVQCGYARLGGLDRSAWRSRLARMHSPWRVLVAGEALMESVEHALPALRRTQVAAARKAAAQKAAVAPKVTLRSSLRAALRSSLRAAVALRGVGLPPAGGCLHGADGRHSAEDQALQAQR